MRPLIRRYFAAGIFLSLILFPRMGSAHILRFSSSEMQVKSNEIHWTIKIHLTDFNHVLETAEEAQVRDYLSSRLSVSLAGQPCDLKHFEFTKDVGQEVVTLPLLYVCPAPGDSVEVSYGLFFGDTEHKHLMKFDQGGKSLSFTFSQSSTETSFSASTSVWKTVADFIRLGLSHILLGFDHVLFVLSLLLGARHFKTLFWLVTAFTLAHSITLALATLDLLNLSSKIVEPAIAASIAFVALRHLIFGEMEKAKADLAVTFFFGLIHGLGFSTVLKEAGIPPTQILAPLLSFNLGVEMGQILIVGSIYPLTVLLRRSLPLFYCWIRRVSLVAITGMALFWLVERIS